MVGVPSEPALPLCADLQLLAQCRGGVLCQATRRCLKRGVFDSVAQVQEAILRFPEAHNRTEARPFR